jgi:hypothetical protein
LFFLVTDVGVLFLAGIKGADDTTWSWTSPDGVLSGLQVITFCFFTQFYLKNTYGLVDYHESVKCESKDIDNLKYIYPLEG